MKRIKFGMIAVMVMIMMLLGGCSNSVNLTDEETAMLAEYISKEVLERDKYYTASLEEVEYEEDEEVEETESTSNDSKNDTTTNQNVTNVGYVSNQKTETTLVESSVDELLSTSTVSVSFNSSKVYDSYPNAENNYFVISANNGCKLLVVTFDLKNTTKKETVYSMLKSDIDFKLTMENGSTYNPLLTLLVDDLQFVNKTVSAKSTEQGVLVFRIAEKEAKLGGTLTMETSSKSASVTIQ